MTFELNIFSFIHILKQAQVWWAYFLGRESIWHSYDLKQTQGVIKTHKTMLLQKYAHRRLLAF